MNAAEIFLETARYYAKDPNRRAVLVSPGTGLVTCEYHTADGNKCAVGRCLNKAYLKKLTGYENHWGTSVADIVERFEVTVDEMLMPRYRGHSLSFWSEVQRLHDTQENWCGSGMSRVGKNRLAEMLLAEEVPMEQVRVLVAAVPGEELNV